MDALARTLGTTLVGGELVTTDATQTKYFIGGSIGVELPLSVELFEVLATLGDKEEVLRFTTPYQGVLPSEGGGLYLATYANDKEAPITVILRADSFLGATIAADSYSASVWIKNMVGGDVKMLWRVQVVVPFGAAKDFHELYLKLIRGEGERR